MTDWQALEKKYYMPVAKRVPVTLVRGQGARVWDDQGKEYLDFVAGWASDSLGHCHPVVVDALTNQARNLIHTSNQFYTVPQLQLAELLVQNTCFDRVFFGNSGTEANEGAVKLARKYGKVHLNGAYEVISANKSFHGRTLAMVAATGKPQYQEPMKPLPEGFLNVDYDDIEAIKRATTEKTCAVLLETVQGEGGVNVPHPDYFKQVRAWCDEKGLLLILDEVQTGMGRTGTLFDYQQIGIEPDVMTLAKGLGGGVPIGAFLAKEKASALTAGEHGTTFGGNPLATAVGYAVLKYILEHDVPGNVAKIGSYFVAGLRDLQKKHHCIVDVRGKGLLIGVQFDSDISDRVVSECLAAGFLINGVMPNAIRFMPPLIIGESEVDEAIAILDRVVTRVIS